MSLEHSPAKQRRRINDHEHLTADQLKVLTVKEWAALNGFCLMTAMKIVPGQGDPKPPPARWA